LALRTSASVSFYSPSATGPDRPNRWPTPSAELHNYAEDPSSWSERAERLRETHNNQNGAGLPLGIAAKLWPTPIARDDRSIYARPTTHGKNSRPLSEAVGLWATPTVADTEGGRLSRSGDRKDELLLRGQAKALHSRQDPQTLPPGETSSASGLILNPLFVEWLMGWPAGFTGLILGPRLRAPSAWTGCAYSEMALFRWRRHMRSALLRLPLPNVPPAQLDLFG
jgi:hypothetical protein